MVMNFSVVLWGEEPLLEEEEEEEEGKNKNEGDHSRAGTKMMFGTVEIVQTVKVIV